MKRIEGQVNRLKKEVETNKTSMVTAVNMTSNSKVYSEKSKSLQTSNRNFPTAGEANP